MTSEIEEAKRDWEAAVRSLTATSLREQPQQRNGWRRETSSDWYVTSAGREATAYEFNVARCDAINAWLDRWADRLAQIGVLAVLKVATDPNSPLPVPTIEMVKEELGNPAAREVLGAATPNEASAPAPPDPLLLQAGRTGRAAAADIQKLYDSLRTNSRRHRFKAMGDTIIDIVTEFRLAGEWVNQDDYLKRVAKKCHRWALRWGPRLRQPDCNIAPVVTGYTVEFHVYRADGAEGNTGDAAASAGDGEGRPYWEAGNYDAGNASRRIPNGQMPIMEIARRHKDPYVKVIRSLSEQDQFVASAYFVDGLDGLTIATQTGLHRQRVSAIVSEVRAKFIAAVGVAPCKGYRSPKAKGKPSDL